MCVLYVYVYMFIFISLYMCIYEMDIVVYLIFTTNKHYLNIKIIIIICISVLLKVYLFNLFIFGYNSLNGTCADSSIGVFFTPIVT